jgi:hypothetical protein
MIGKRYTQHAHVLSSKATTRTLVRRLFVELEVKGLSSKHLTSDCLAQLMTQQAAVSSRWIRFGQDLAVVLNAKSIQLG